jgi:hypothetical protein
MHEELRRGNFLYRHGRPFDAEILEGFFRGYHNPFKVIEIFF